MQLSILIFSLLSLLINPLFVFPERNKINLYINNKYTSQSIFQFHLIQYCFYCDTVDYSTGNSVVNIVILCVGYVIVHNATTKGDYPRLSCTHFLWRKNHWNPLSTTVLCWTTFKKILWYLLCLYEAGYVILGSKCGQIVPVGVMMAVGYDVWCSVRVLLHSTCCFAQKIILSPLFTLFLALFLLPGICRSGSHAGKRALLSVAINENVQF